MAQVQKPMFVCHANCCRSVLAYYLYQHLCAKAPAFSAGFEPGKQINDRALAMLQSWGINAIEHQPRIMDRKTCEEADAIFVMGPEYMSRLIEDFGLDLAHKSYLFADPFSHPYSFQHGEYLVYDPSFDTRSTQQLVHDFTWMRERVLQIRLAMLEDISSMVPASTYLRLLTFNGLDMHLTQQPNNPGAADG